MGYRSLIVLPLTALAACGSAPETGNTGSAMAPGNDVAVPVAITGAGVTAAAAPDYVRQAALGDMYEIESSQIALEKSQSQAVRGFAQQMIDDHHATTQTLKDALGRSGLDVTPPASLDVEHRQKIDSLRSASGQAFDRLYLDQQTSAHEQALALHRGYADGGDNPELKAAAAEIAPKVASHLDRVRRLDAQSADGTR